MDAETRLIEVTVEIPSGSRNTYEYDHRRHRYMLDRVLYSSVHHPCDYGFIEGTMADRRREAPRGSGAPEPGAEAQ